jgi:hypothetical protein
MFLRSLNNLIVLMMAETCLLAEAAICYPPLYDELRHLTPLPTDTVETVAIAAVAAAAEQGACAIVVLSTSGNTARLVAKYRPNVPIITGGYPQVMSATAACSHSYLTQSLVTIRPLVSFTCTGRVTLCGTPSLGALRAISGRPM